MTAIFKIALACLIAGAALSFFGITTETVLAYIGWTTEDLWAFVQRAAAWAIPNIILGSLVVLPAWLLTYIFLPPGND